jgi:hypothetical protein
LVAESSTLAVVRLAVLPLPAGSAADVRTDLAEDNKRKTFKRWLGCGFPAAEPFLFLVDIAAVSG